MRKIMTALWSQPFLSTDIAKAITLAFISIAIHAISDKSKNVREAAQDSGLLHISERIQPAAISLGIGKSRKIPRITMISGISDL